MNTPETDVAIVRDARLGDVPNLSRFIKPFVRQRQLLPRSDEELAKLVVHGFVAECRGEVVAFAAIEIYSRKLAEVQCLAVDARFQGKGIGKQLVQRCVQRAHRERVKELMAISSSDSFLRDCGFDYSLPDQKRALFIRTHQE